MDQPRRKSNKKLQQYMLRLTRFKTGRRSDSAHAYIHSTRAVHSNLHLQCNTKVDKVIMEDGKAVGVRTMPTKPLHPSVSNKSSPDKLY
jgi:alcohol oxidase